MSARYSTQVLDDGRVVQLTAADGRMVQYHRVGEAIFAVTEGRPGSLAPQVCQRLAGSGHTLLASSDAALVRVIRREARRAWDDATGREPAYLREVPAPEEER